MSLNWFIVSLECPFKLGVAVIRKRCTCSKLHWVQPLNSRNLQVRLRLFSIACLRTLAKTGGRETKRYHPHNFLPGLSHCAFSCPKGIEFSVACAWADRDWQICLIEIENAPVTSVLYIRTSYPPVIDKTVVIGTHKDRHTEGVN